jgi:hypothetical protein
MLIEPTITVTHHEYRYLDADGEWRAITCTDHEHGCPVDAFMAQRTLSETPSRSGGVN